MTTSCRSALVFLVVLLLGLLAPATADAAPNEADRLFEEGLALLDAGRYDEACAKLEASHRVEPAPGTLMSIGDCYSKAGKTASAWRSFREATEFARRIGDADRVQAAAARASALEKNLSKLVIVVTSPMAPAMVVRRDNAVVEPVLFGVAVPIDPALTTIEAAAPSYNTWTTKVDMREGAGRTVTITVPPLTASPSVIAGSSPSPTAPPTGSSSESFTPRKKTAAVVGGIGVLVLGVAGVFAIGASSDWDEAKQQCEGKGDPLRCSNAGAAEQARSAGRQADVATVAVGVGVVALAAAAVLWLTDRR